MLWEIATFTWATSVPKQSGSIVGGEVFHMRSTMQQILPTKTLKGCYDESELSTHQIFHAVVSSSVCNKNLVTIASA